MSNLQVKLTHSLQPTHRTNPPLTLALHRTPFIKPVMAPTCHHIFCSHCIHRALSLSPTCPIDRSPLVPDELVPAPGVVRQMVDELAVYCTWRERGCDKVLERETLPAHLGECDFGVAPPTEEQGTEAFPASSGLFKGSGKGKAKQVGSERECELCQGENKVSSRCCCCCCAQQLWGLTGTDPSIDRISSQLALAQRRRQRRPPPPPAASTALSPSPPSPSLSTSSAAPSSRSPAPTPHSGVPRVSPVPKWWKSTSK